jgi:hypothetical protein
MSFDALTILGILATVLSGGFLVALVSRNDSTVRRNRGFAPRSEGAETVRPLP